MRALRLTFFFLVLTLGAASAEAQYFRFGKNKVQYEARTWSYLRTQHFDVYFYEGGQSLARFTAHAAEDAYDEVSDLFDYDTDRPIPFIVYASHDDFAVTNAVDLPIYSEGIGGVTELFKNRIAVPFTGDFRDFRRVIHHELVHAFINEVYYGGSIQSLIQNNIRTRIPLWFNEGLAEFSALGWDTQSDLYVREAVLEDDLDPILRLGGYFAYRGGQSVWDYVAQQYGRETITDILTRLRVERSVEAAFRKSIGIDLEQLSDRWHRSLKEIYFPEMAAREKLADIGQTLITQDDGLYNTAPALSPTGDRLAFITTRDGLFDIYLADAETGSVLRRLAQGQRSTDFESLRILTPSLSWSPDGKQLAVAVKRGGGDAIAVIQVESGRAEHVEVPGVDQVLSVAWSPDGHQIAFSATMQGQADLYILRLGNGALDDSSLAQCCLADAALERVTNDAFSDLEPAWSPDGAYLAFHSDRRNHLAVDSGSIEMHSQQYGQLDLFRIRPGADAAERLTFDESWDETRAQFGDDASELLFISDRNGIPNLYALDLVSGIERPVTDLTVGALQQSMSADGRRVAVVSLQAGIPSIFLIRNPFRRIIETPVRPTVWALRAGHAMDDAPALSVAAPGVLRSNPYLRAVSSLHGTPRGGELLASLAPAAWADTSSAPAARRSALLNADSTGSGLFVDFRNYTFGRAFFESARSWIPGQPSSLDDSEQRAVRDESGEYVASRYKLTFTSDIVQGAAGYDALYGVQGVTQMLFSDLLGNHRLTASTNLLMDLRNSDYTFTYAYLPRRIDWSITTFHIARLLADFRQGVGTYYRYRQYGSGVSVTVPFSKFNRLDAELSVIGATQTDITHAQGNASRRVLLMPRVTFTRDVTTPGFLFPSKGHRLAVSATSSLFGFGGGATPFLSLLGDARSYHSFGRGRYVVSFRASTGLSVGPERQLFYSSGVTNWINRQFDEQNGFPIGDASDFVFATPVLPIRGFAINARNGSYFGLINAEFRFPLIAAMIPGPLPLFPLYSVSGVAFADAGSIWGGRGGPFRLHTVNDAGQQVLDDLLLDAGFGLRAILLGYPLRIDFAWPYDGHRFGHRQLSISLGLDF